MLPFTCNVYVFGPLSVRFILWVIFLRMNVSVWFVCILSLNNSAIDCWPADTNLVFLIVTFLRVIQWTFWFTSKSFVRLINISVHQDLIILGWTENWVSESQIKGLNLWRRAEQMYKSLYHGSLGCPVRLPHSPYTELPKGNLGSQGTEQR